MLCLALLLAASALNALALPPAEGRFNLIKARPEVEAELVWDRTDALGHGLTGEGVVICDVDAPPDIFHPMFFKADRGRFTWIDVDGSGHWSPGDAVDMDGNGLAHPDETLAWLPYEGEGPPGRDTTRFQAGYDFLYQDANGNGGRDFGPPAFTETDPCYGEGLFLVDDFDGNEQLDIGESLVGLKTSKFRAIDDGGRVYRRGVDLINARHYGEHHGTLVCGVLAGGWPGLHHLTGIAPDAELLSTTGDLQFALDEGLRSSTT